MARGEDGGTAWPSGSVQTSDAEVSLRWVGPREVILLIDGMESSFHDLDDPGHLEFEYMQHMDAVVRVVHGESAPLRALHLGGAGCCLARAWDASHPGSAQLAIEWDGELARLARQWFPLPRAPRLRIRHGDARAALDSFPPKRWDVIVRDVFVRAEVPAHLADAGAAAAAARTLAHGGVYLVNTTDRPPLSTARGEVSRLLAQFASVVMIADPAILRGRRYGNLVLAAADTPLDAAAITHALRPLPMMVRVVSGADLVRFADSV